jgi:dTDP-4-dehydrorhamnose reductase
MTQMRPIVVVGSNGQLGSDIVARCGEQDINCLALTHADIDITSAASVQRALDGVRSPIVTSTVSCHGTRVDPAKDPETYFRVNEFGVRNLAIWCEANGTLLVHYSTDYVFGCEPQRADPYREDDLPCPVNVYGRSKLAGESAAALCAAHNVIRIASLYGRVGCRAKTGGNFVHAILDKAGRGETLRVTTDQVMNPTWTRSVATKTLELLEAGADFGIYHLAGSGSCTWHEFACQIVRLAGRTVPVERLPDLPVNSGSPVARPRYTALDNARLRRAGLADLPRWQEALAEFMSTD